MKQRWLTGHNRPRPESVQFGLSKFENIWGADGSTWLFDAVLVDLGDAIADELYLPLDRISWEMVYRGLDYFHGASNLSKRVL